MERHLDPKISGLSFDKEDHPGCLWGVLHVLRHYQWQHLKKMRPNKRIGSRRQARSTRYSRLKSNVPDTSEAQGSGDAEADEKNVREMSNNRSGKGHMKNLIAEERSKELDGRCPLTTSRSHFLRTDSIHHLEPSNPILPDEVREDVKCQIIDPDEADFKTPESTWDPFLLKTSGVPVSCCNGCDFCGTATSVKNLSHDQLDELGRQLLDNALLQNKLERAKEAFSRQTSKDAKESPKDVALNQSQEVLDALEMFNANNGLFQSTLHDSNYALAHHLQALQASNAKKELTKSESFPIDESLSRKSVKPSNLKYMQKEAGFIDDNTVGVLKQDQESTDIGQTSTSSSLGPHVELKKRRFKDFKQKIKNAIKESRKERHRISMDAIFHKMPYGSRFSKDMRRAMTDKSKESVMDVGEKESPGNNNESNNSMPILGNARLKSMRRTQSLSESLNKYSQLFELSFGRETKQHLSDSLKLASGSGASSVGSAPKALGRIQSLPDLESYCSLQCDEYGDFLSSRTPSRILVDSNTSTGSLGPTEKKTGLSVSTENQTQLDAFVENGKLENLIEVHTNSALNKDQAGLILDSIGNRIVTKDEMVNDLKNLRNREGNSSSQSEQEIRSANTKQAQPSPISVLDSCFQEDISSPTKLSVSEGSELKPRQNHVDELVPLASLHDQSGVDFYSEAITNPDLEKVEVSSRHLTADFRHVQVDKKDEADFNYVRDVLKLSGFSVNEFLGTWHSPDQPVDPCLFEEVEICSPLKSDYSGDEVSNSYDHQPLFDIINEVLLEIYERSFTYCPRPLSCNCHIRPMPTGYHVLEEVWAIVRWYLNSQPEFEPLDYLVVRDLSKSDGWMNLQFDSECVGLELEEMILDDLLEEVICA